MADIQDILTDILRAGDSIDGLKKSLSDLAKMKASIPLEGINIKSIRNIEKLQTAVDSLTRAKEDLAEAEKAEAEARKAGGKALEEAKKRTEEITAAAIKQEKQLAEIALAEKARHDEAQKRALEQKEDIINRFKQNTLLGKSYSALTGPIAKFAAGLTAGTLALKAIGRFTDAAKLRNDMMIASYRKLDDTLGDALSGTLSYESAMRQAESAAIRYGMANENVADMMIRYQRVVGESTPEALGALTEATLAMAKVMGITGAQAIDYVQARMDNFGGTAADALKSLDELREGTVKYNTTLQGVRIRGDDVIRTIQDITNSNGVYAVDQRFLSQVLMRTSATLQAQGESYNFAQKQAENYTKALTSDAPEWMQITNAFDIAKDVMSKDNMVVGENGAKSLTDSYAAELERAKPGLSKKVTEILNSPYSEYDKTRLLGETLKDTEIGMKSMSAKIVELGNSSISTLAAVYGKSYMEAETMFKSAKATVELEKIKGEYLKRNGDELNKTELEMMKIMGISKKTIMEARNDKSAQKVLLSRFAEKKVLKETADMIKLQKGKDQAAANKIHADMLKKQAELDEAKKGTNKEDIAQKEAELAALQESHSKLQAKIKDDNVGDMGIIGKLTAKVDQFQQATGLLTGNWLKAAFNDLSSPLVLAAGAAGMFIVKGLGGRFDSIQSTLDDKIYKVLTNIESKTGGDGSGGGSPGGGGKFGKRGIGLGNKRTILKRLNPFRKGGFKGVANNIMRSTRGSWKGLGGLAKNAIKGGGLLTAGLGAVDAYQSYKEKGLKGAAKSMVSSGSAMGGSAIGAAIGTALLPGIGTAIGMSLGGMAGGALGDFAGDMYEKLSKPNEKTLNATQNVLATQMPNAAAQKDAAINGKTVTSDGPMPGLGGDMGKLNPDGSVTLTINNFMDVFAQSMSLAKQNGIRA
jgi:hypothetical protein